MNQRNSKAVAQQDHVEDNLRNRNFRHQKMMLSIDPIGSFGFDEIEQFSQAERDAIAMFSYSRGH